MLLRAVAVWIALVVVAILNAGVREKLISPRLSPYAGHVISSITLSAAIFAVAWLSIGWIGVDGNAWRVGLLWLSLTVAFEFMAGHHVFKNSWAKLFADYNVFRGRVWVVVLIATLLAPVWAAWYRRAG